MGYAKVRSEAYPSLFMPGFPGSAGLKGGVSERPSLRVAAKLAAGSEAEYALTDLLTDLPVHVRGVAASKYVKLARNDDGRTAVASIATGLDETLRTSIAEQTGVDISEIQELELRVYRHRYDVFADDPGPEVLLESTFSLDSMAEPAPSLRSPETTP